MKKTLVINSEFLGRGDDELGAKLMHTFMSTLLTAENLPDRIIFYNSAVKLLADNSSTRETIDALHKQGVLLQACGTCVAFFKLAEKIPAEHISNMREIVAALTSAEQVVTV